MSLSQLHTLTGNAFLYFSAIIAAWALIHYLRRRELGGDFWGAVVIGEGLIAVQALLGLILLIQGAAPARWVHLLYGVVSLITWPSVFAATRGGTGRREALYWTLASAFLFGIALRAISTAR